MGESFLQVDMSLDLPDGAGSTRRFSALLQVFTKESDDASGPLYAGLMYISCEPELRAAAITQEIDLLKNIAKCLVASAACIALFFGYQAVAQNATPANVAGTWNIVSTGDDGQKANQIVQFTQQGDQLTGHFKGPRQSGDLSGVMNGNHISFDTKTHTVLHFSGTVEGEHMEGTLSAKGKNGSFTATRSGSQ
jgi:hypothetical protein